MAQSLPLDLLKQQSWLDPVAERVQPAIARALGRDGMVGTTIANALHGTWLVTDVPIGSWTAAAVLDLVEANTGSRAVGRGADAAIKIGLFGAAAAAITGIADWSKMGGGAGRRIGLMHGLLNVTATACYLTSLQFRRKRSRGQGRGYAFLGFLVANAAAYLGGHLVYSERIGVDHSASDALPEEFVRVLTEAELEENRLMRVEAAGAAVLLLRRGDRIYAIGETCAHLGGPLSEGTLEDLSIRCPWHASCFSLEDGRVLEGPSVHDQPLLEARVRDGHIEVRKAPARPKVAGDSSAGFAEQNRGDSAVISGMTAR
jgi:nitrite reductase/ring-hydroxylating ferredoxin subunit